MPLITSIGLRGCMQETRLRKARVYRLEPSCSIMGQAHKLKGFGLAGRSPADHVDRHTGLSSPSNDCCPAEPRARPAVAW